jgi:hypothetical protein
MEAPPFRFGCRYLRPHWAQLFDTCE